MRLTFRAKFYAVLFGLLFACILIEVGLRLFWHDPNLGAGYGYFPDSPYVTQTGRLKANWRGRHVSPAFDIEFQTNAAGFRASQDYGQGGIAVIGDSFVEATQVEEGETFVALLGGQNFGTSDWGPLDYLDIYRTVVRGYAPDVVVVCFFAGNDIRNSNPDLEPDYRPLALPLVRGLMTFRYLVSVMERRAESRAGWPLSWYVYEEDWFGEYEVAWAKAQAALTTLVNEIRADGARPMIVLMPDQHTVYDDLWRELADSYPGEQRLERGKVTREMATLAGALDVEYVDLTADFQAAGEGLYFRDDGHLRPKGHALVATVLRPIIEDEMMPAD